ncbi:telomerase reverse transcriptase [Anaeramoeba ignava]|uniref:Telomerase reverse transcriptase n=1 Tax=Anaeramoeba ignava TaxID=1746090 RepID=A0A9Q0RFD3_ANAIG|nr:telomerase reverse transcriptase [Anaeramoeba ignava]
MINKLDLFHVKKEIMMKGYTSFFTQTTKCEKNDKDTIKKFKMEKHYDTRIATIELQKELKKHNNIYIIQLDIKKCFGTINHTLIKSIIDKYVQHNQTQKFLIKSYDNNELGIY